ncbi:MAG: L-threonylcarbamoyladenylate synthase [Treponemataceae bacterium]
MILKIDDPRCFSESVKALKNKKIVILPTDTIYGFSGVVPETKQKILKIKKSVAEKKMIRLIAKPEDIYKFTDQIIPSPFFSLWPAALTLIVLAKNSSSKIAFRCPSNKWLRDLIEAVGVPIFSSSVNLSGSENLKTIPKIAKVFERKVKLIVDAGELTGLASTVVDLTLDQPMILRRGSVEI